jgi:hypothetical protein
MRSIMEVAAKISTPWSLAAFAIAAILALLQRRGKIPSIAWAAVIAIVLLGLIPILAPAYLESRGLYRVRVIVLDEQRMPVNDAKVTCSVGGEPKKVEGGWEFDVPAVSRPTTGRLAVYAAVPAAFLGGSAEISLADDFNPVVTVNVARDRSARVRGTVVTREMKALDGVYVSVSGYPGERVTTVGGGFDLPAHAASGQQVQLHAEIPGYKPSSLWVPAGDTAVTIVLERR